MKKLVVDLILSKQMFQDVLKKVLFKSIFLVKTNKIMSLILQLIGSIFLVLNQVFKSKRDLVIEQQSIMSSSPNLTAKQVKKIIVKDTINTLGFLFLFFGYLIQLFNFDAFINDYLDFEKTSLKIGAIIVLCILSWLTIMISVKVRSKGLLDYDKNSLNDVVKIWSD